MSQLVLAVLVVLLLQVDRLNQAVLPVQGALRPLVVLVYQGSQTVLLDLYLPVHLEYQPVLSLH